MIPLYVLAVAFVVLRAAGALGIRALNHWQPALRGALSLMFLLTASAHWGPMRADLVRMVPPGLPYPELLVTFTGLAEVALAIGILVPQTRRLAAGLGILMLVAMFPANVRAAQEGLTLGGRPVPSIPVRAFLQVVFIAALAAAGLLRRTRREGPSGKGG